MINLYRFMKHFRFTLGRKTEQHVIIPFQLQASFYVLRFSIERREYTDGVSVYAYDHDRKYVSGYPGETGWHRGFELYLGPDVMRTRPYSFFIHFWKWRVGYSWGRYGIAR